MEYEINDTISLNERKYVYEEGESSDIPESNSVPVIYAILGSSQYVAPTIEEDPNNEVHKGDKAE